MIQSAHFTGISALVVRTGLSYVAWTQIIPAVLVWLFAIMMLAALGLIGMEARGENPADLMQAFAERFPGFSNSLGGWVETRVTPSVEAATDPESGAVHLDRIDFWGAASYVWFWLSLAGALLGFLWRMIVGPRPRRPLGSKLLLATGACVVYMLVLFIVLLSLPTSFESSTPEWLVLAASAGMIVCVVTSWSVACAHGLGKLADLLAPADAGKLSTQDM